MSLVRVAADAVIQDVDPNAISGFTQVVSDSIVGASSIGVQSDGATRYVVTAVESFAGVASGSETITFLSAPATATCESLGAILPVTLSLKSQEYSHSGRRCIGVQRNPFGSV